MKKQRTIKINTLKSVFAHSGNMCAFPGCNQLLMFSEDFNISNVCHISGLNVGSARYNSSLSDDFLNSEKNLILLCPTHHSIVDKDEKRFTVDVLVNMKKSWEEYVQKTISIGISYRFSDVKFDTDKAFDYYYNEIGIREITKQEVEKEISIFSRQSHDVKIVMMKILDLIHEEPDRSPWNIDGYMFNMMSVFNELNGDSSTVISVIKYLMRRDYIEERKYSEYNDNSLCIADDGTIIDISKNYRLRIEDGEWRVLHRGQIIDAVYRSHRFL